MLAGFFYAQNLMPPKIAKPIYNGDEWNDDDVMMMRLQWILMMLCLHSSIELSPRYGEEKEQTMKRTYQVEYRATYWVRANSEDEAIELGIEQHSEAPDGDWEGFIDPHVSPLDDLDDGTYIQGVYGIEDIEKPMGGYWIGTEAVQAVSDVPIGKYLGVWTDPNDGKRYYDLTVYQADLTKALKLGKEHGQKSIWDIAEDRPIPVNI